MRGHLHGCLLSAIFVWLLAFVASSDFPPPCDDQIYCTGPLLDVVQSAVLHKDSKYFVDMSMKKTREETMQGFKKLLEKANGDTRSFPPADVKTFVEEFFGEPGSELEEWTPGDWQENPSFLDNIKNEDLKGFAKHLHGLWRILGRKIKDEVRENKDRYSIIYVPHGTIVPGGRFREFYYWDSYWVVKPLLLGGMMETAKGMLRNFAEMIDLLGFVPNGGRVYYYRRSQPPYFIPMINEYIESTGDLEFLKEIIGHAEKEYSFWMNQRTTDIALHGKTYKLAVFNASVGEPRPESYREDKMHAQAFANEKDKEAFYADIKSAAESGWDFSTRWYKSFGTTKGNLTDIETRNVAPVDLNSLMCFNAAILAKFHDKLGNAEKAKSYYDTAAMWNKTIQEVLWDEADGIWYDFDIRERVHRKAFYASNVHPMWTDCYGPDKVGVTKKVIDYLWNQNVLGLIGGVPTSTVPSGEQWDHPNGWAPLQHIMVEGLRKSPYTEAHDLAMNLAQKWVRNNWRTFETTKHMFEKYDTVAIGYPGGGGEYDVQVGFGWSNGVAIEFINTYADRMEGFRTPGGSEVTSPTTSSLTGSTSAAASITSLETGFFKAVTFMFFFLIPY